MVKTFDNIEKIVNKYSETSIEEWEYDGVSGFIRIEGNPYEGQIWNIISELGYVDDNITKIELRLAEDMDDDYDTLDIWFIEIYNAKDDIYYYQEVIRIKDKVIKDLKDEIEELKKQ